MDLEEKIWLGATKKPVVNTSVALCALRCDVVVRHVSIRLLPSI
jgi:hypothetical protein